MKLHTITLLNGTNVTLNTDRIISINEHLENRNNIEVHLDSGHVPTIYNIDGDEKKKLITAIENHNIVSIPYVPHDPYPIQKYPYNPNDTLYEVTCSTQKNNNSPITIHIRQPNGEIVTKDIVLNGDERQLIDLTK